MLLISASAIRTAVGDICSSEEELKRIIERIDYPIVIKPLDGNHGKGASINVSTWEKAVQGLAYAKTYSSRVIGTSAMSGSLLQGSASTGQKSLSAGLVVIL